MNMANPPLSESDPRYHTQNVGRMMEDLIDHLREDIDKVDDPQAKALFEVSAEVLQGLRRSLEHFESKSEKAWK
jgi:t-SNARE complex subunit (syntaxin)